MGNSPNPVKIMVVDGNSPQIIAEEESSGRAFASKSYKQSLLATGIDAQIDIIAPYSLPSSMTNNEIADCSEMLAKYDGFALAGSGVDWGTRDSEAKPYLAFLEKVFDCQKPVIGSCWGMQTVAALFGGDSCVNPAGTETGIARDITLTKEGRDHFVFEGVNPVFSAPAIHRDHVCRLPEGSILLAGNENSPVQAFSIQNASTDYVGSQFHPELSLTTIYQWYSVNSQLPETIEIQADFADEPNTTVPAEISREDLRILPLKNWMTHVRQKTVQQKKLAQKITPEVFSA